MKTIIAKNNSGITKTYFGQLINDQGSYTLQSQEELNGWSADALVNTDIWSGDLVINDGTNDLSPVNGDRWLKSIPSALDSDGVPLSRTKVTQTGWHYQIHCIEFDTGLLNSKYNKDINGNDLGFLTVKYYDANNVELVAGTQLELTENCVKTVATWEPGYDIDIVGGLLLQDTRPTTNVRMWVVAVPDVPVQYGGSVPFAQGGLNLKHIVGSIDIDGLVPKYLFYDATYHTTKFQITVKHDLAVQHPIHMVFKVFRQNA